MPLMILVVWVWVTIVQSECITNPMDDINKKAKAEYKTTDEVLEDIQKSNPNKYQNLLRVYGIYRACVESGTKRWTDNVGTGSGSCPHCRTKIEEEDKIWPKLPDVWNSSLCVAATFCHESQQGCFYYGVQGSEEECKGLGVYGDGSDFPACVGDGNTDMDDYTCQSCRDREVRTYYCPIMCGYCRPRCNFFCKNYGYMKRGLCECDCDPLYTGKQCEVLDCSLQESDKPYCTEYTKEACENEVSSVGCPYLCGLCKI